MQRDDYLQAKQLLQWQLLWKATFSANFSPAWRARSEVQSQHFSMFDSRRCGVSNKAVAATYRDRHKWQAINAVANEKQIQQQYET